MIGQNVRMLMPEPYRSRHEDYLSITSAPAKPRLSALAGRSRDSVGTGRSFLWSLASPLLKPRAKRYFVGFIQDLSERRRFEARMHDLHADRLDIIENMTVDSPTNSNSPSLGSTPISTCVSRLLKNGDLAEIEQALDNALQQVFSRFRNSGQSSPIYRAGRNDQNPPSSERGCADRL